MHQILMILVTAFLVILSAQGEGAIASFRVTGTGGAPIPASYSASDTKSLVLSSLAGVKKVHVCNDTASVISFSTLGSNSVAPGTGGEIPVAQNQCASEGNGQDVMGQIRAVYIRAPDGAVTALSVRGFAE